MFVARLVLLDWSQVEPAKGTLMAMFCATTIIDNHHHQQ